MLGVFGGSFNPIHTGHLLLAEFIREEFQLEKVLFIPAGKPPHKDGEMQESAQHRYDMLQIAIQNNPMFEASSMEIQRQGFSYTAETLEQLTMLYPGKKLFFICGADSIINLPTWRNIGKIFELATLIVAGRPNIPEEDFQNMILLFREQYHANILLSGAPQNEISSTVIRDRIRKGFSVRYMIPDEVERYIRHNRLYGLELHP